MPTPKQIVATIDRRRKEAGLSHVRLCELAGVDPATWWRARQGKVLMSPETEDVLDRALSKAIRERKERRNAARHGVTEPVEAAPSPPEPVAAPVAEPVAALAPKPARSGFII